MILYYLTLSFLREQFDFEGEIYAKNDSIK